MKSRRAEKGLITVRNDALETWKGFNILFRTDLE